jgi:hypothetical protein
MTGPLNGSVPSASVTLGPPFAPCKAIARLTSLTLLLPTVGAIWSVLSTPKARPSASMKALPESPGMPGVTV